MATLDDVARLAAALPEVTEGETRGRRSWSVGGKVFAWERRFSKADVKRYGDAIPPSDPILATRVQDVGEKEAVLGEGHPGLFTIPHFNGYAAILVQLDVVDLDTLRDAIVDAWLACAPPALARRHLDGE